MFISPCHLPPKRKEEIRTEKALSGNFFMIMIQDVYPLFYILGQVYIKTIPKRFGVISHSGMLLKYYVFFDFLQCTQSTSGYPEMLIKMGWMIGWAPQINHLWQNTSSEHFVAIAHFIFNSKKFNPLTLKSYYVKFSEIIFALYILWWAFVKKLFLNSRIRGHHSYHLHLEIQWQANCPLKWSLQLYLEL